MEKSDDINISEEILQQIGIILLILAAVFSVIGYFTSPLDDAGKPVLLLPEEKTFEDYRRSAADWLVQINSLDAEITAVLSDKNAGDLFTQSRQAQTMLQNAVDLNQAIDQIGVPAAASGIHQELYDTSLAYLNVAQLTMQWVGAPEDGKKEAINTQLEQARGLKTTLEKNQWVSHR
jgi:hypothetical protein